jgi:TetR/AcrR family transcriptional regulator, transcriptional repressor for nem operon
MPRAAGNSSKDAQTGLRALGIAERLAQTRGFNGFSYADIAAELGITKATLHYHFATKADLGLALITRYARVLRDALARITGPAPERLRHYVQVYEHLLVRNRMCLCGMLAAEYATLPKPMQRELALFFAANDSWLAATLERGRTEGTLEFSGSALEVARMLTAALEGALLLARSCEQPERFAAVSRRVLLQLTVIDRARRAPGGRKAGESKAGRSPRTGAVPERERMKHAVRSRRGNLDDSVTRPMSTDPRRKVPVTFGSRTRPKRR